MADAQQEALAERAAGAAVAMTGSLEQYGEAIKRAGYAQGYLVGQKEGRKAALAHFRALLAEAEKSDG